MTNETELRSIYQTLIIALRATYGPPLSHMKVIYVASSVEFVMLVIVLRSKVLRISQLVKFRVAI